MPSKELMELARKIHREAQSGGAAMSGEVFALERWSAVHDGEKTSMVFVPSGYWTPWHTANAEITRLRAEVAELRQERDELIAENRLREDRCVVYGRTVEASKSSIDELRAQIAAHERECAGVWVNVEDRLPEPRRVVSTRTADNSWMPSNWIEGGAWRVEHNRVVEWLDARLPGEKSNG